MSISFGINPLSDPFEFEHAYYTSILVSPILKETQLLFSSVEALLTFPYHMQLLFFMVLLVYSVISPLTNFVLGFFFLVLNTLFRHQFIFIYPSVSDSGGKIWMGATRILINCMIVAEITREYHRVA
jgi:hypothetical protein